VLADDLLKHAEEFLAEAKANPTHPIRTKFDQWVLDFAHQLITGDVESRKKITDFIQGFTQHSDAEKIIQNLLTGFKHTLKEQLSSNETPLMLFVICKLNKMILDLENDIEVQDK